MTRVVRLGASGSAGGQWSSSAHSLHAFALRHSGAFVLAAIIALALALAASHHTGTSWLGGSDNFIYTFSAAQVSHGSLATLPCCGEDNVKYLLYFGISLFYNGLFGYTPLTQSMFGLLCMALTVVSVYLIGKRVYGAKAGLAAAFVYPIIPLVSIESTGAGDSVPMAFLATLSILLIVYAMPRPGRRPPAGCPAGGSILLALSGFVAVVNFLIVPEATIGFMISAVLVLYLLLTRRVTGPGLALFLVGSLLGAAAIMGVSQSFNGSPLYIFATDMRSFDVAYTMQPFATYMQFMFPENVVQKTLSLAGPALPGTYAALLWSYFAPLGGYQQLEFGYIGYALAAAAAYLIATRERRAALPAFWFSFAFLYLSFGSQGITRYIPLFAEQRFLVLLCPAIALLVGIAAARFASGFGRPAVRAAAWAAVLALLAALLCSSAANIIAVDTAQYYFTEPMMQTAQYVNSLPYNATVFTTSAIEWEVFTDQAHTVLMRMRPIADAGSCGQALSAAGAHHGDYVVDNLDAPGGPPNLSACGLETVFSPGVPRWLLGQTLFGGQPNFWNVAVYRYVSTSP